MKWHRLGPLGLFVALAVAGDARAAFCGVCSYSGPSVIISDQCCPMPEVRHRIRYQPVTETHTQVCYRPVYHTVMEQQCYTVCKPVYETHMQEHRYTVCKPVTEHYEVQVPYTVCKPVYEQHLTQH